MEALNEEFLSVSSGSGSGDGSGDGSGYGYGSGYGDGSGDGSGYGSGYGYGYGYGSGSGYGYGYGYGSGYGSGDGDGSGDGSGDGDGVKEFNGCTVYIIDGIQTLLYRIRGVQIARGAVLNDDLTTTPCYIAKQGNTFAHGETLREAMNAALDKAFDEMPVEERLDAFRKEHEPGKIYQNRDFFSWHHRLTGSCEMGRRQFAREHGIDVEDGTMTPEEFIRLTESAYRGDVIRMLKSFYPEA